MKSPFPPYGIVLLWYGTPFTVPTTRICFRPPRASATSCGSRTRAPPPRAASSSALNRCSTGISNLGVDPRDLRAERQQLRLDRLVAAVNMLHARYHAGLGGGQRGQDERCAGAQVGDLHLAAMQRRRPGDACATLVHDLDHGAHLHQLDGVVQAVLV